MKECSRRSLVTSSEFHPVRTIPWIRLKRNLQPTFKVGTLKVEKENLYGGQFDTFQIFHDVGIQAVKKNVCQKNVLSGCISSGKWIKIVRYDQWEKSSDACQSLRDICVGLKLFFTELITLYGCYPRENFNICFSNAGNSISRFHSIPLTHLNQVVRFQLSDISASVNHLSRFLKVRFKFSPCWRCKI